MLKFTNNASATLAGAITASATSVVLTAGNGSLFPALNAGEFFYATLVDSSNNLEVVKVTARTTDTLTVVRDQDGSVARAYAVGDKCELRLVAAVFSEMIQRDGSIAMTANLSLGGFKATNVADPASAQDAATKNYVDTTAVAAVNAEAATRAAADTALTNSLNSEIANRQTDTATRALKDGSNATGTWGSTTEWTRVNNRPTALNQFTNNLGNYGGWVPANTKYSQQAAAIGRNAGNQGGNCGNITLNCRNYLNLDTGSGMDFYYYSYNCTNCNCNCCCC